MNVDEVLQTIEKRLLSRQLSAVERLIISQSWLGKKYSEIAENTAYGGDYLKEVGSQLWQALSEATGEKVTKKNLSLILDLNQASHSSKPKEQQWGKQFVSIDTPPSFPGGPLPIDSPLYINRPPVEELIDEELRKPGCMIRVKAPQKSGKSSLLNRILFHADSLDYRSVCLDLQEADKAVFASLNQFLRWFCSNINRLLDLELVLDDYWDEEMGSKVSCRLYFEQLLAQIKSPVILTINEVHRIFEHPYIASDFLPMLRFWHEVAQHHTLWRKLRLVIIYTTEIYIPLRIHQSPFNVGLSIHLPPFTAPQVQELATRYGLIWQNPQTQQLMAMVGGHPYLVNIAFYYLAYQNMSLEQLLQEAPTLSGVYSHYLQEHLLMLQEEPQLADTLQAVTTDKSLEIDAIAAYKLESLGLVQLNGNRAEPSCEMYRLYFRQQLRPREAPKAREKESCSATGKEHRIKE
ncbi:MAG: AAA-like domain-containing protein [Cyanophyceae cyanobacterium]